MRGASLLLSHFECFALSKVQSIWHRLQLPCSLHALSASIRYGRTYRYIYWYSLGLRLARVDIQVEALDRPLALLPFFLRKEGGKLRCRRRRRHRRWWRNMKATMCYCCRLMRPAWHGRRQGQVGPAEQQQAVARSGNIFFPCKSRLLN